jgi:nucleoside-diphosphate-sugar epimerase
MILVTGATGLVGAHLLYNLCRKEDTIRATKRDRSNLNLVKKVFSYYTDDVDLLFNKIEWVEADLLNITELEDAFLGVTKVYHCAAWVNFNPKHKYQMIANNVNSTAHIVNLCLAHKVKKLCHVSSVAAIGRTENNSITNENTPWTDGPENSNYAISKYNSELEVWRGVEEGLNAVIVNPSIILGPGAWKKGSSVLFHKIATGMPFYTTGTNGFVDVRDVAKVMIELMESPINSERFILCSESIPFKQTFDYIADALGKKRAHIKVGDFLNALGWRLAKVISIITRKAPILTKETAKAGNNISIYENHKIKKSLEIEFIPVAQSCKDFSEMYLKDLK